MAPPTLPRWFHAYNHMDELLAYARSWCGERSIYALDAFGYSGTIALLGGCSDVGQGEQVETRQRKPKKDELLFSTPAGCPASANPRDGMWNPWIF